MLSQMHLTPYALRRMPSILPEKASDLVRQAFVAPSLSNRLRFFSPLQGPEQAITLLSDKINELFCNWRKKLKLISSRHDWNFKLSKLRTAEMEERLAAVM
jgi:hypothetical protein